jgi:hypothetical protein
MSDSTDLTFVAAKRFVAAVRRFELNGSTKNHTAATQAANYFDLVCMIYGGNQMDLLGRAMDALNIPRD